MAGQAYELYPQDRHTRPVTFDHARTSAGAADRVIATIRPCPQGPGNARFLSGPRGRRSGSGAASGQQHQRGLRVPTGHEHRHLVARVAAGRQWTAVPPSAHAGFLQRASSFHLIGRFRSGPDCSSRSRRSPGSTTPPPISANGHPLARHGRAVCWLPCQARLNQPMNDRSSSDMLTLPIRRTRLRIIAAATAIALLPVGITFATATAAPAARLGSPSRPQDPCDIYAAGGTPCVGAYSTTRALYASYNGPLYQVMRLSDNAVKDIGVVQPRPSPFPDPGGYADAAAQDAFCANTTCVITKIYDQSPHHNDLTQAPRGAFGGPAMGGFDNLPIADTAPITIGGHKAYGVFIAPGMGLRNNHPTGTATGDQPEGMYWVIDGHHFNDGCCFDFGNAEIDSHDDGDGTMETSYFGNATAWYHGNPLGPWIMTDQENNLVGCVNPGST